MASCLNLNTRGSIFRDIDYILVPNFTVDHDS